MDFLIQNSKLCVRRYISWCIYRRHPSLNVHWLKRPKGKIAECYIDKGMRLLFDEEKGMIRIYNLGGHEIIDRVNLRSFDNYHQFSSWQIILANIASLEQIPVNTKSNVPYQPRLLEEAIEDTNKTVNYFRYFRPAHLRILGVPPELIMDVMDAPSLEDALELSSLPETARSKMRYLSETAELTDVMFESSRLLFRTTLDRLEGYCEGKIKKLMLDLEPEQSQYVEMKKTLLFLLKGAAGSGKTTIGIYRAIHLAEQGRRVLLLTFNNTLSLVTKTLIEELIGPLPDNLEVKTLHSVMVRLLSSKLSLPKKGERYPEQFIDQALAEAQLVDFSNVLKRDRNFFQEEIKRVIKGLGIASVEEYKSVKRYGRKTALGPKQRESVWKVYEAYQQKLVTARRHDWSDVALMALQLLQDQPLARYYDDIIVDEAQDLTPVDLRVIQQLAQLHPYASTGDAGVMLLGDAAQTLYSRGFSWEQAGVHIRGRTATIKKNHRNTHQIAEAAAHLLKQNTLMRASNEYVDPEWTSRQGPLPSLIRATNPFHQIELVKNHILNLVGDQIFRLSDFAILCRTNDFCMKCKQELEEAGLRVALSSDEKLDILEEQIKVFTIHSAKGLEFPVVFLMGLMEGELPFTYRLRDLDEEEQQLEIENERTLCYVGMTRAADVLYLLSVNGRESRFIQDLSGKIAINL